MNTLNLMRFDWLSITAISAQANSHSDVKRSGRSQNRRLQKGLPA
jgi:hypothetical protein